MQNYLLADAFIYKHFNPYVVLLSSQKNRHDQSTHQTFTDIGGHFEVQEKPKLSQHTEHIGDFV